jgi:hypothetical protein
MDGVKYGIDQLEGLSKFLLPLDKGGVNFFNGKCASNPHRAAKFIIVHVHIISSLKLQMFFEYEN